MEVTPSPEFDAVGDGRKGTDIICHVKWDPCPDPGTVATGLSHGCVAQHFGSSVQRPDLQLFMVLFQHVMIMVFPRLLASQWNAGEDCIPKLPRSSRWQATSLHLVNLIGAFDPE